MDRRMSAHRCVRRRHAKRFIYGNAVERAEIAKHGKKIHIDLLKGIPNLEKCARSGIQPWYRNETEQIDTVS
jgi:hypothetical protein